MCLQHYHTTIFIRLITGFNFAHCLFTVSHLTLLPGLEELLIHAQNRRVPNAGSLQNFLALLSPRRTGCGPNPNSVDGASVRLSLSRPARLTARFCPCQWSPSLLYHGDLAGGGVEATGSTGVQREAAHTHREQRLGGLSGRAHPYFPVGVPLPTGGGPFLEAPRKKQNPPVS